MTKEEKERIINEIATIIRQLPPEQIEQVKLRIIEYLNK